jgi:outer membrane usher protein
MLAAARMRRPAQLTLIALAALPLLFHPCLARADAMPSPPSPAVGVVASASDQSLQPSFLSVSINGTPVSDGTELLSDAHRNYFISSLDLTTWRIATPSTAALVFAARQWYSLASFGGVAFVDMTTESIEISIPGASFTGSRADLSASSMMPAAAAGLAATSIGYDVRTEFAAGTPAIAGFLSADHSYRSGSSLQVSGIARSAGGSAFTRLGTTWERDDPASMTALKIGDAVTHAGALGVPTLFAGVSWGTDFNTAPGFITFPLPSVSGIATLPSTFSVVANGINTG